jgi:UDP-glucose:(heptosyl)LPS alpha-1,3-glucosyltransferase
MIRAVPAPSSPCLSKLLAIGGRNERRYQSLARRFGVEDRVILPGRRKDVARYYRAGDLFLFPTLYEHLGMVILEAMASGLPPVVSRLAGAAELIEGGVSGILLENPSDPERIAAALGPLIDDETARVDMGRRACAAVAERTWDRVACEYGRILEPLMVAATQNARTRLRGPSGAV